MHQWDYTWNSTQLTVVGSPRREFIVNLSGSIQAADGMVAEHHGVQVDAQIEDYAIRWGHWFEPCHPHFVGANGAGSVHVPVRLPWDATFIRLVEEARAKRPGDFVITLRLTTRYRLALPQEARLPGGQLVCAYSNPLSSGQSVVRILMSRDAWLRVLTQIGWDEFEVFEVPVRSIIEHEPFKSGLELLRAAQQAFRAGDWQGAVLNSRKACEAAMAIHAGSAELPETDIKKAAEVLSANLFPDPQDQPRRDLLDTLLKAVVPIRHATAHGRDPRFRVRREDAELALGVVIHVFRYMGETLGLEARPA